MSKPCDGEDSSKWLEQGDGSESSGSDWSSSEDSWSIDQGQDNLHLQERTDSQPLDTALVDTDAEAPGMFASFRGASRSLSRSNAAEGPTTARRRKAPWSCYRAMGQGGRALALAGVTFATLLGIMKISGA